MGLILSIPQSIGLTVITCVTERKIGRSSSKSMLHTQTQAITATTQITLQLHAKLSRKIGVVPAIYKTLPQGR